MEATMLFTCRGVGNDSVKADGSYLGSPVAP